MPKKLTQEEFVQRVRAYTNDTVEVISKYVNKRTLVKIQCKKCGHIWSFSPNNVCPTNGKTHTFKGCPECFYETLECSYCHKTIKRLKSDLETNKSGFVYCSRDCGNKHKNDLVKLADNSANYRRTAFENYEHKCAICGYDEEKAILEVHHIDENRKNNSCKNLIILCPNCHKKLTLHLYTLEELLENI